ncbi:protein FAM3C [Melanotaenia boesemani]|uniref:protein FAM3C n=1 Tax=Melanotaenia boesemani TaxID=1250792 RepID=UPI001C050EFB|nr:protein FAM3C [Melanotaenia boesemani]
MGRRSDLTTSCLKLWILMVLVLVVVLVGLQLEINPFKALTKDSAVSIQTSDTDRPSKKSVEKCSGKKNCPDGQFSFYMKSGAANVVGPNICVNNKLILGTILNNVGTGINIAVLDGKTGALMKSDHFDMYSGEIEPLITFLKSIKEASVVLIATFDEPSSRLNEEARKLIADLGSASINSLGFRDNWLFVGGKGTEMKSNFEKYIKNDRNTNAYENWPELIELQGCIPKFLD